MRGVLRIVFQVVCFLALLFPIQVLFAPEMIEDQRPENLWQDNEAARMKSLVGQEITTYFGQLTDSLNFNGAVLVTHKGQTIYSLSRGLSNIRSQENLSQHSAFQLASVSKMFTATAVMLLQQDGKLAYDDLIQTHLPEWPYADQTIRHLLTHRSGLARYMAVASWYWKDLKQPMSNADVLAQYANNSPITFFSPDSGFNYCNTNYVILAQLVERVSGIPFPTFMQQRVFDPLGMEDAYVYSRGDSLTHSHEVQGYKPGRSGYYLAGQDYIDGVWGDKNLYASIADLQKYEAALYQGKLLSPDNLAQAWNPGSPTRHYNYGFGWRIKAGADEPLPYHFGWWRGFRSCYIHDHKTGIGLIILSNIDDSRRIPDYWDTFAAIQSLWPERRDVEM
ncbi:MAG: beta-lactamase family protein [Bacteroidia bacterium]|nr:beta-lactamase family protein [Bacteroidia bacterium]